MDVALLGYLLGIGTVFALVKRGDKARSAVAWSARQAGFISARVSTALNEASQLARTEFEKARLEQSKTTHSGDALAAPSDDGIRSSARLNGN
jgi:hypothetical protein